jgi:hypothetical protein
MLMSVSESGKFFASSRANIPHSILAPQGWKHSRLRHGCSKLLTFARNQLGHTQDGLWTVGRHSGFAPARPIRSVAFFDHQLN